jgi:hypothetical protein
MSTVSHSLSAQKRKPISTIAGSRAKGVPPKTGGSVDASAKVNRGVVVSAKKHGLRESADISISQRNDMSISNFLVAPETPLDSAASLSNNYMHGDGSFDQSDGFQDSTEGASSSRNITSARRHPAPTFILASPYIAAANAVGTN